MWCMRRLIFVRCVPVSVRGTCFRPICGCTRQSVHNSCDETSPLLAWWVQNCTKWSTISPFITHTLAKRLILTSSLFNFKPMWSSTISHGYKWFDLQESNLTNATSSPESWTSAHVLISSMPASCKSSDSWKSSRCSVSAVSLKNQPNA